jgi:hypothetical protein
MVRGLHRALSHFAVNTRQADVETNCELVGVASKAEVHLGFDR